ncbi:LptF/LptG family permease [Candidatus Pelagibacter sp.]|nr:LptF/LptG family permease [Candidatus Pelagibacter sp.]
MKTFEIYLIKLFLKKIINITLVFFCLVFVLGVFEEISFFKNWNLQVAFPFLMTLLSAPTTVFEIFPFIFLISVQFFFLELISKNELEVFKYNGLDNVKIIKLLSITSFLTGLLLIIFYYNISSKMQFVYLDLKNKYSNDNKYLAVVTENGLWIKDEVDKNLYIINADQIKDNYLEGVSIAEFDSNFNLVQLIESSKIDISKKRWVIFNPRISIGNKVLQDLEVYELTTHFDKKKIKGLFRNLSSLNIVQLYKLKKDYKSLGYSTKSVNSHLNKLISFPFYITIMSVLSSIIMLNIKRNKPIIFHIIVGISLSVVIYYFNFLFNLLGENGNIPILLSTWLPLIILTFFIIIGLVRVNEK